MLRTYQAHNYLLEGDQGRARAEIFKTRQAIQDSKDLWEMELEVAREEAKKRKVDLGKTLSNKSGENSLKEEREKIQSMVPSNLPRFVNPAALYLEALYFLHSATQREDFAKRNTLLGNSFLSFQIINGFRRIISWRNQVVRNPVHSPMFF